MPEENASEQPKLNRRDFLIKAGKIGIGVATTGSVSDSLLSHYPTREMADKPGLSRSLWEHIESGAIGETAESLKKEIQEAFNVVIVEKSTDIGRMGIFTSPERSDWDAPRLQALKDVLTKLPAHFYSPLLINGSLKPLKLGLGKDDLRESPYPYGVTHIDVKGIEKYDPEPHGGFIYFQKAPMGQTILEQEYARLLMVHEFMHYATTLHIDSLKETILHPIVLDDETILSQTMRPVLVTEEEIPSLSDDERRLYYAGSNFNEFFGTAGEFYVRGKDHFVTSYTKHLGEDRAQMLYESIRDSIFYGKEY